MIVVWSKLLSVRLPIDEMYHMYDSSIFRLKHHFNGIDLDIDDDVYIYQLHELEQNSKYELYEIYKILENTTPILNHIRSWSFGENYHDIDCISCPAWPLGDPSLIYLDLLVRILNRRRL